MKTYKVTTNELEWLGVYWDDIIFDHERLITMKYNDMPIEFRKENWFYYKHFQAAFKYHRDWFIEIKDEPEFNREDMISFACYSRGKTSISWEHSLDNWIKLKKL